MSPVGSSSIPGASPQQARAKTSSDDPPQVGGTYLPRWDLSKIYPLALTTTVVMLGTLTLPAGFYELFHASYVSVGSATIAGSITGPSLHSDVWACSDTYSGDALGGPGTESVALHEFSTGIECSLGGNQGYSYPGASFYCRTQMQLLILAVGVPTATLNEIHFGAQVISV